LTDIRSKEHPAYKYYPGKKEPRDWMFEEITDPQHSFFSFWKKCKKILRKKDDMQLQFSFTP
jgi:deoxyribodipyrimidine photo-lyase